MGWYRILSQLEVPSCFHLWPTPLFVDVVQRYPCTLRDFCPLLELSEPEGQADAPRGELFAVRVESGETEAWSLNMHWDLRDLNLERPCQKLFRAHSWLLVPRRVCECSSLILWFIMSFWAYSFDFITVFIILKFPSSSSALPNVTPKVLFCSPVSLNRYSQCTRSRRRVTVSF